MVKLSENQIDGFTRASFIAVVTLLPQTSLYPDISCSEPFVAIRKAVGSSPFSAHLFIEKPAQFLILFI